MYVSTDLIRRVVLCGLRLDELVLQTPRLLQLDQLVDDLRDWDRRTARLRADIVAVADVDGLGLELGLADDWVGEISKGQCERGGEQLKKEETRAYQG